MDNLRDAVVNDPLADQSLVRNIRHHMLCRKGNGPVKPGLQIVKHNYF